MSTDWTVETWEQHIADLMIYQPGDKIETLSDGTKYNADAAIRCIDAAGELRRQASRELAESMVRLTALAELNRIAHKEMCDAFAEWGFLAPT